MKETTKVTKEEFDQFIKAYPSKLETDEAQFFEPPMASYNDFSDGKVWPESVVAFIKLYDGSEYHFYRSYEYYIIK